MLRIFFENKRRFPVSVALIKNVVQKSGQAEKKIKGAVEIILLNNSEIKKLNKKWRRLDRPTDVLAFAWREGKGPRTDFLGQIFISYPRVVAQAKILRRPAKEEFIRVLIHGLLHLVGYDHQKNGEAKRMFSLQEKLVKKVIR